MTLKKNINLPNLLTFFRVIAVPVFILLLLSPDQLHRSLSLVVFALASITDFFDGYLARKWKQETELGKFMDPLADKALVLGAFLTFLFMSHQIQIWMVLTIVARDFLITYLRSLAIKSGGSLRTSRLGKFKTAFQMFSIIVILLSFIFVTYKERSTINDQYSQAIESGAEACDIAYNNFVKFTEADYPNILFGLSSFVPYYLMLITTLITVISGIRYLYTNYSLIMSVFTRKRRDESGR
jgi:cardiolipin synthase (CMP-forming)